MNISKEDLEWAASGGLLSVEQSEALWKALQSRGKAQSKSDLPNLAYYLGALIVISAMTWFMTQAWESLGGGGLLAIAVLYALGFLLVGRALWKNEEFKIPGGLLVTMAVCMVPLAIYGLERLMGVWPDQYPGSYHGYYAWIKGGWVLLEVGTILAGLSALKFFRFPFLTAPIAFSLWFMTMDLPALLLRQDEVSDSVRVWASLGFGLVILLVSYLVDRRTREDYAFWGYLFGMLAFWGAISFMTGQNQGWGPVYCAINLGLMLLSVLLQRRVFLVFGSLGVFGYVSYLAYSVFNDSLAFPFVLTAIGLLVIYLGTRYQRNRERIEAVIRSLVPKQAQRWLPLER